LLQLLGMPVCVGPGAGFLIGVVVVGRCVVVVVTPGQMYWPIFGSQEQRTSVNGAELVGLGVV
jgi:hypothetical protein